MLFQWLTCYTFLCNVFVCGMLRYDEVLFIYDTFWAEMAKKTFAGGMCFPHLAHLMTTLSVITHSNADSERVFEL